MSSRAKGQEMTEMAFSSVGSENMASKSPIERFVFETMMKESRD